MKVTDGDDPSRREEENNSNGSINGRNSPNGQILINGHHILTNSDNSDNEAADENNAEHSHGYVLLPQNDQSRPPNPEPEISDTNEEDDDEDDQPETLEDILQRVREHQQTQPPTPHIQSMIEESQRQVEIETVQLRNSIFTSQPTTSSSQQPSESRSATIDMSQDRVETIRSAMSSIQLPASAIPPWASNLSDEEIQNVLRDKLSDVMSVHKKS